MGAHGWRQVLFNFRADRMVEISKAFEYEDFDAFDRVRFPKVGPAPPLDMHPASTLFPPLAHMQEACSVAVPSRTLNGGSSAVSP